MSVLRIAGGGIATLILSIVLMTWPRTEPAVNAATKVRQSLDLVNTWHLSGWKRIGGKQVPWEIWGRREPFFYREQVGGETQLDDGVQRTYKLTAAPKLMREHGMVVVTPTQRGLNIVGWGFTRSFKANLPVGSIQRDTPDEIAFGQQNDMDAREKHDVITISKRTWLPTRYEVQDTTGHMIIEHLEAEYDVPLTAAIAHLDPPTDYLAVDALNAPKGPAVPSEGVARNSGLTVQLTPLAMDSQGRILARVRGWLGSVRIDGEPFSMHVVAQQGPDPQGVLRSISDDQGRPYLFVDVDGFRLVTDMNPGTERLVYFAPRKRLPKNAPLPRRLDVTLDAAALTRAEQSSTGSELVLQELIFMSEDLTWHVGLPTQINALDPDAYLFKGWRERVQTTGTSVPSLDEAVVMARARMGVF